MNIYKRLIRHLYNKAFPDPITDPRQPVAFETYKTTPLIIQAAVAEGIIDGHHMSTEELKDRLLYAMGDSIKDNMEIKVSSDNRLGITEWRGQLEILPPRYKYKY